MSHHRLSARLAERLQRQSPGVPASETVATVVAALGRAAPPRLSVVMPCWNEAASLSELLPRLVAVLAVHAGAWEILVVDDGSTDGGAALLASWAQRPGVRVLQLSRNFGKEAALSAGFDAAAGDVVVSMDADGQHDPALIPEMIRRWRAGADMVCAVREDRADEGPIKRAGTSLFYRLLRTGQRFQVPRNAGDFRLLDRRVVDALRALPERTRFMKGLYAWVGFRVDELPYQPLRRVHGRSHFRLRHLFGLSAIGLTAFTTWPLRAASVLGLTLALASFGYGAYLVAEHFIAGSDVSGWTTIVVGMALLSGVQLMSLGVVGEYLARVFDEVKGRPLYVVREQLGSGLKDAP